MQGQPQNYLSQRHPPRTHLVESGHRLVCTPNLDLEEGGLIAVASLLRTLGPPLLGIVPRTRPPDDILALPPLKGPPRVDGPVRNPVLVRASQADEAILARCAVWRQGEEIRAMWADYVIWSATMI